MHPFGFFLAILAAGTDRSRKARRPVPDEPLPPIDDATVRAWRAGPRATARRPPVARTTPPDAVADPAHQPRTARRPPGLRRTGGSNAGRRWGHLRGGLRSAMCSRSPAPRSSIGRRTSPGSGRRGSAAVEGRPRLVLLAGEAGIGKSRLVAGVRDGGRDAGWPHPPRARACSWARRRSPSCPSRRSCGAWRARATRRWLAALDPSRASSRRWFRGCRTGTGDRTTRRAGGPERPCRTGAPVRGAARAAAAAHRGAADPARGRGHPLERSGDARPRHLPGPQPRRRTTAPGPHDPHGRRVALAPGHAVDRGAAARAVGGAYRPRTAGDR